MFVLGHLGFGLASTRSFVARQNRGALSTLAWLCLGFLLPDLIDKVLFYSRAFGLPGTRTFGHSLLFLVVLFGWAFGQRREGPRAWAALGAASHVGLDHAMDALVNFATGVPPVAFPAPTLVGFVWPLLGAQFPPAPFASLKEHASSFLQPAFFIEESLGVCLLLILWVVDVRNLRRD